MSERPGELASPDRARGDAGERVYRTLVTSALLLFFVIASAQPIDMVRDLGRHLKNGEIILRTRSVPDTNTFSYTYPDFPFVNHHWGSGVLFHLTEEWLGFAGLSALYLAVSLATFWLSFRTAWKAAGFETAVASALVFLPLALARLEVRPEIFSTLFMVVFLWLLDAVRRGELRREWLLLLPATMLLWVNLHIYHVFGLFLLGVFLLESLFERWVSKRPAPLAPGWILLVSALSAAATLANPAGWRGAIYPLRILGSYGYEVFENQSIVYLLRYANYPAIAYFLVGAAVLVASALFAARRCARGAAAFSPSNLLLAATFLGLAFAMVRNFAVLAYFGIPLVAMNVGDAVRWRPRTTEARARAALAFVALVGGMCLVSPGFWRTRGEVGIGLKRGTLAAARFLIEEGIEGPIFNNFDTGGYLVYALFPGQRVFVDNRPEAYPVEFFRDEYVPMQAEAGAWREALARYGFNAIVFNHTDQTSWGQEFLIARVDDPEWVPVFLDRDMLILVRNVERNRRTIERYRIPRERFGVSEDPSAGGGAR
jgi:hypothetical protein